MEESHNLLFQELEVLMNFRDIPEVQLMMEGTLLGHTVGPGEDKAVSMGLEHGVAVRMGGETLGLGYHHSFQGVLEVCTVQVAAQGKHREGDVGLGVPGLEVEGHFVEVPHLLDLAGQEVIEEEVKVVPCFERYQPWKPSTLGFYEGTAGTESTRESSLESDTQ